MKASLDGKNLGHGLGAIVTLCRHEDGRPVVMERHRGAKDDCELPVAQELIRKSGAFVPAYALLYFAGTRPAELQRLGSKRAEFINRRTTTINIPASISKTKEKRLLTIGENPAAWLDAFPGPIIPPNYRRGNEQIRKHFKPTHDEARHSFISYHVALHRSTGDAALQAGNSEAVVKGHYLNTHPAEEGAAFFAIVPDLEARRAVLSTEIPHPVPGALKAI